RAFAAGVASAGVGGSSGGADSRGSAGGGRKTTGARSSIFGDVTKTRIRMISTAAAAANPIACSTRDSSGGDGGRIGTRLDPTLGHVLDEGLAPSFGIAASARR